MPPAFKTGAPLRLSSPVMRSGYQKLFPDEGGAARALCEAGHHAHIRTRARHLAGAPQIIKVRRSLLEHAREGRGWTPQVVDVVRGQELGRSGKGVRN